MRQLSGISQAFVRAVITGSCQTVIMELSRSLFSLVLYACVKFMFSNKATKIDDIFDVDLTVTTYCQIEGEDFVNFCGLLRKRELYVVRTCLRADERV